jgi:superfamily I DNA/RNA helicase
VLIARQFWDAFVQNRLYGKVTFVHNCYLKLFQLELTATGQQLCGADGRPYDAILVDEAQDMNGVTMAVLLAQNCTQLWAGGETHSAPRSRKDAAAAV